MGDVSECNIQAISMLLTAIRGKIYNNNNVDYTIETLLMHIGNGDHNANYTI